MYTRTQYTHTCAMQKYNQNLNKGQLNKTKPDKNHINEQSSPKLMN